MRHFLLSTPHSSADLSVVGNAETQGGSRFREGYGAAVPTAWAAGGAGAGAAAAAESEPPPPVKQRVPFWKKRWFFWTQLAIIIIGIVMLFVLLWPVVKAVAQAVLNKSVLNVTKATITNPTNTS